MISRAWFFGFLAVLIVGAAFVSNLIPDADPFSDAGNARPIYLDKLSGTVLAGLKRIHARNHGRYDIGLFGNSRSLNVAGSDIGIDGCSFFNFSVGSESLRSSIAYLELLAADGRLPRIAAISVDNFELQRYNNPLFLSVADRWALIARDMTVGWRRQDISLREVAKMGWRHAIIESRLFMQNFQVELFRMGLKRLAGLPTDFFDYGLGGGIYIADGSRRSASGAPMKQEGDIIAPGSPQILFGYLRYDLERLKRLQDRGTRVVMFETLLEPKSARVYAANPSAHASATRKRFLSICEELSFHCQTAPGEVPFSALPWEEITHPPGKSTGAYLSRVLADEARHCRRDL